MEPCATPHLFSPLTPQEPTLRFLSVQIKYGPWREALMVSWRSGVRALPGGAKSLQQASVDVRAKFLVKVLRDMCARMQGKDDKAWVASLGRGVSHVSGPLATLNRLRILRPSPGKHLMLGMGQGSKRRLCSGVREFQVAAGKLRTFVKLADEAIVPKAPRSCRDWVDEHFRLDAIFTKHAAFPPKKYMRNWVIRALLLASMARDGVQGLTGSDSISTAAFSKAFPDSKGWMARLSQKGSNGSLHEFCQSIGYTGDLELLSAFTCLLLTKDVRKNPAWLQKHGGSLRRRMTSHAATAGLDKLPALCVREESSAWSGA